MLKQMKTRHKLLISLAATGIMLACRPAIAGVPSKSSVCKSLDHPQEMVCIGKEISDKKAKLDALYRTTLANLPDSDPTDKRKGRAQLEKSQIAWKSYIEENCDYVGAQEGGSNSWVSYFAAVCLNQEYEARIKFLTDQ
jgi:uncharacterized protein YecT (DUF1311 family)